MNQEEEVNREKNIVALIFPLESFCSAYLIIELCISIIYVLYGKLSDKWTRSMVEVIRWSKKGDLVDFTELLTIEYII